MHPHRSMVGTALGVKRNGTGSGSFNVEMQTRRGSISSHFIGLGFDHYFRPTQGKND